MWGLALSPVERAEWMTALDVGSYSSAAAVLYRWSTTASVVAEEWKAIAARVRGIKSTYAADELDIAITCISAVASDLDYVRRGFAALAAEGGR